MARKRTTLPTGFDELLATDDLDAQRRVYDRCRLDAYERGSKATALSFIDCPADLMRWLVDQGLDVDSADRWGLTPLSARAQRGQDITLLLELGADVNAADGGGFTALHYAVPRSPRNVRILVDHGADPTAPDDRGRTPLQAALERCSNSEIVEISQSARILLDAGSPVPANAAEQVVRIGKQYEFIRGDGFNREETDTALAELYAMFGVAPVPRRRPHDGTSRIVVTATDWVAQFDQLWELLVPSGGAAATMQGEVIRLAGVISHELLDNGGINWDRSFRAMRDALISHLNTGEAVTTADELADLATGLRRDDSDVDKIGRIAQIAVAWVLANPDPMPTHALNDNPRTART